MFFFFVFLFFSSPQRRFFIRTNHRDHIVVDGSIFHTFKYSARLVAIFCKRQQALSATLIPHMSTMYAYVCLPKGLVKNDDDDVYLHLNWDIQLSYVIRWRQRMRTYRYRLNKKKVHLYIYFAFSLPFIFFNQIKLPKNILLLLTLLSTSLQSKWYAKKISIIIFVKVINIVLLLP